MTPGHDRSEPSPQRPYGKRRHQNRSPVLAIAAMDLLVSVCDSPDVFTYCPTVWDSPPHQAADAGSAAQIRSPAQGRQERLRSQPLRPHAPDARR